MFGFNKSSTMAFEVPLIQPCFVEITFRIIPTGQLSSYAIRDVEEYKNFCDRPKDQRPQPEEVIAVCLVSDETILFRTPTYGTSPLL